MIGGKAKSIGDLLHSPGMTGYQVEDPPETSTFPAAVPYQDVSVMSFERNINFKVVKRFSRSSFKVKFKVKTKVKAKF